MKPRNYLTENMNKRTIKIIFYLKRNHLCHINPIYASYILCYVLSIIEDTKNRYLLPN